MNEVLLKDEFKNKRVLITGGLGMIGSNLACELVKYGAKVTIIDACLEPYGANMFNVREIINKVKIIKKDIRDKEVIRKLVKNKDIIYNFAAQVSHNDSINDPFLDADINYIGHLNIMENVRLSNPSAKVLFSGSRLQFGKITRIPVKEDQPLQPKTPYAFNKSVAENMYRYYNEMYGIATVVFRIANPYGIKCQMKHSKYSIVNYFIRQAMENKDLLVFGSGNQLRDYIYISDLVGAFLLAGINKKADGEIFNIGSGTGTKFKDMINTIGDVVGSGNVKNIPWPKNYLNVETGDYVTDISKAKKVLGWRPKVSLVAGVKKTHDFYSKYKRYYF